MGTAAQFQPSGAEVKQGAYLDHIRSGSCRRQQDLVLVVLALAEKALTRHAIAERGEMALSAACGRARALLDLDLVEEAGTEKPAGARSPRTTLRLTAKGQVDANDILREVQGE